MKELTLVVAAMTLLVYGCSEQNGPVEPVQSSGVASTAAMGKMCTMNTTTGVKSLTSDGGAAFGPNIITTSVRITARNG